MKKHAEEFVSMSLAMERHGDETTVEQELVSWRPASSLGRARRGHSGATNTTKRKSMVDPTNKQDEMTGPVGTHGCCVLALCCQCHSLLMTHAHHETSPEDRVCVLGGSTGRRVVVACARCVDKREALRSEGTTRMGRAEMDGSDEVKRHKYLQHARAQRKTNVKNKGVTLMLLCSCLPRSRMSCVRPLKANFLSLPNVDMGKVDVHMKKTENAPPECRCAVAVRGLRSANRRSSKVWIAVNTTVRGQE